MKTLEGLIARASARLRTHLLGSIAVKQRLLDTCEAQILEAARTVVDTFRIPGKLLLCGHSGSGTDCQHIAAEFVSVLNESFLRPGLPATALTTDTSILIASANDFEDDGIFARQFQAFGARGDVLLGHQHEPKLRKSCLRDPGSVLLWFETICLTGGSGRKMAWLAETAIVVPSGDVQHIQECHITIGHLLDLGEKSFSCQDKLPND